MSVPSSSALSSSSSSGVGLPQRVVCRCCQVSFPSLQEHKLHHRSDWHSYNLRRYLHGLSPVSLPEFNRKRELALLAASASELSTKNKKFSLASLSSHLPASSSLAQPPLPVAQTPAKSSSSSSPFFHEPQYDRRTEKKASPEAASLVSSARQDGHFRAAPQEDPSARGREEVLAATRVSGGDFSQPGHAAVVSSPAFGPSSTWAQPQQSPARLFDRFVALHASRLDCLSLFDTSQQAPFSTCEECLDSMRRMFGFLVPDREYLTDVSKFMRIIWKAQRRAPRCLLCEKRFKSIHGSMQHMREKGHTQLKWAEKDVSAQTALQRKLVEACYDYRPSYALYLGKKTGKRTEASALLEEEKAEEAEKETERRRKTKRAGEKEEDEVQKKKREDLRKNGLQEEEENGEEEEEEGGKEEEEGSESDWEDFTSSSSGSASMDEEEDEESDESHGTRRSKGRDASSAVSPSYEEIQKLRRAMGGLCAQITEAGDLRLPDGRELVNRHVAYIYKQRLGYRNRLTLPEVQVLADLLQSSSSSSSSSPPPGALVAVRGGGGGGVAVEGERELQQGLVSSSSRHYQQQHRRLRLLRRQGARHNRLLLAYPLDRWGGPAGRGRGDVAAMTGHQTSSSSSLSFARSAEVAWRRRAAALKAVEASRKAYVRNFQAQSVKLGVKHNKLQKFILQENKFFF